MKVTRINAKGERKETLLKEYFLTASLLAFLQRIANQAAKSSQSIDWSEVEAPMPIKLRKHSR